MRSPSLLSPLSPRRSGEEREGERGERSGGVGAEEAASGSVTCTCVAAEEAEKEARAEEAAEEAAREASEEEAAGGLEMSQACQEFMSQLAGYTTPAAVKMHSRHGMLAG